MTLPIPGVPGPQGWGTLHPSAFRHRATLTRWVPARARQTGATRYRCPVTACFVVVTDDATLQQLTRPRARLRCPSCKEIHLLTQTRDADSVVTAETES